MPRRARPRWREDRGRWSANIGEIGADGRRKEMFAPETIGERDEAGAWDWLQKSVQARATAVVKATEELAAEAIIEAYLAWAEQQSKDGKLPASEFANRSRHLTLFADALGGRVAKNLTSEEMTTFAEGLLEIYAPTYARNVCATVRLAFNWAIRKPHKLIEANPILGYTAPTVPRSPARFAERREAAAFLGYWRTRSDRRSIRGQYDRLTLLLERALIRTGARPKELCLLRWPDIQWKGWVTSSGHTAAKGVIPPDRWKAGKVTGKPRTIYFTPAITRALRRVRDQGFHSDWVFVHGGGRGGRGAGEPWPSGSVLSKTILRIRRELIACQAELRERIKAGEDVRPLAAEWAKVEIRDEGHDRLVNYRWRHTAISTLLMLGVDVSTVAELTGTSPEMIYRTYGHLLDRHLQAAAENLVGRKLA